MANDNIDYLNRIIDNLYTAVFERSKKRFNAPLKNSVTTVETITIGSNEVISIKNGAPEARYYGALSIGGTYVQANGVVTPVTIDYGAGCCDETQMWVALRIKPTWAYNAAPGTFPTIWRWSDDTNNRLIVYWNQANNQWTIERKSAASSTTAGVGTTHAANDAITIIAAFTATQVKLSVNGAAFVAVGNTNIPTLAATQFNIGYGDQYSNTVFTWMAMGIGSLTDAEAAAIHARGNTVPTFDNLLSDAIGCKPTFLWPGVDSSHTPSATYSEVGYAA